MTGPLAAIVLAGGASSRFGGDKLVAPLEGRPLLHHAIRAAASAADLVVLVMAPGARDPALPVGLHARVILARDRDAHGGPLAGLSTGLAALAAAGTGAPAVDRALVLGGDMPALVPSVLRMLADTLGADDRLGAVTLEADPPAILPMAVRPSLAGPAANELLAADRRALRGLLARVPAAVVPAGTWRALDPGGRTLLDVDVPRDIPGPASDG